jgi:transcriptional regulator with XRE-family HTH domain
MKREVCPTCGGSGFRIDQDKERLALLHMRAISSVMAKDIATELGFSAQYLCDIENGRRPLTPELIKHYKTAVEKLKNRNKNQ